MKKFIPILVAIFVITSWLLTWWAVCTAFPSWQERGQFGDLFGSVNALFSGFAFAGLIYAILLQRQELSLQRDVLRGAEDTTKRQLRAYLSAKPDYIFTFSESKLVEIKFTIVNHGQTPASKVQSSGLVDILPYPLPQNYPLPSFSTNAKSNSVIHPNSSLQTHVIASRLFSKNEITKAVTGVEMRIYVFGRVTYTDVFGEAKETIFCSSVFGDQNLNAVAGGIPIPTIEIKFEPTDQHNEAT